MVICFQSAEGRSNASLERVTSWVEQFVAIPFRPRFTQI